MDLLQLKNYKLERLSPEKPNVKISVQKLKITTNFDEIIFFIKPMLEELHQNGQCQKTIIYCNSIGLCGNIFMLFDKKYQGTADGMFHSKTPKHLKARVMEEFSKDNGGKCFIVVATSALGMGINIKNIRQIVHVGLPTDVEAYIQEIGRAGRDGLSSKATLFYRPACDISHCNDQDLVRIIKNKENLCRRVSLLKCFDEVPNPDNSQELHECCDVCEKLCVCVCATCSNVPEVIDPPKPLKKVRAADEEEKKAVIECLRQLRLAENEVKLIVENIDCIQTETDILHLGIEEPTSMFVNLLFNEVFNGDSMVTESTANEENDKDIDILSLNQPYESLSIEYDSDDNIFLGD